MTLTTRTVLDVIPSHRETRTPSELVSVLRRVFCGLFLNAVGPVAVRTDGETVRVVCDRCDAEWVGQYLTACGWDVV